MKSRHILRYFVSYSLGAALFFAAHFLVGGFNVTGSPASLLGLAIFILAFIVTGKRFCDRWFPLPKNNSEIDVYSAVVKEIEDEKREGEPISAADPGLRP